jgi:hypothetical protein
VTHPSLFSSEGWEATSLNLPATGGNILRDSIIYLSTRRRALDNMKEDVEGLVSVDRSECDLVESVAGKVGGRPVVKGRVPPSFAFFLGRIDIYTLQLGFYLLKWKYVAKPL